MDTIKGAAKNYWAQGLAVVPVEGKRPLVKWAEWQSKAQTLEEFESLPWDKADGFGVLCGLKGKNGLYLAVIDVDRADFNPGLLRTTQIDKTPRGGYHFVYWSRQPVEVLKRTDLKVELLGLGNICIMAPSKGYRRLNDNPITEVDSAKALFNQLIVKLGGKPEREIVDVKRLLKGVKVGERDNAAIRLATWYRKKGLDPEETLKKLVEWDQLNEEPLGYKTLKEKVKSAFKLSEPYAWFFNVKPERRKFKHVPFVELPDGRLVEQAYDGKENCFLVFNPASGLVDKLKEIETEDTIYRPIRNGDVEAGLTLLPSEAVEYGSDETLFKELVEFMNRWHDQPSELERKLDALYVMLTYVYDLLPRIPYRRALGALGRGKTAWLDTVGCVCYRPLILAGCDTDKAIVRRIDLWRGTALIDEADFSKSSLYAFIVKILNVGYDRKLGYYQRSDDINPKKVIVYNVYGPKILATRERFKDTALESRCLSFVAMEKRRSVPLYRDKRFMAEAQALRNKLILWRFRKYAEFKHKVSVLESAEFEKELGLGEVSARVKEVLGPLTLLGPQFKWEIEKVAEALEAQIAADPDVQLENMFHKAMEKILYETEQQQFRDVGAFGDVLGCVPNEEKINLKTFMVKTVEQRKRPTLHIALTRIAKTILQEENPDTDELKSLNRRLSKILRNRLNLRVFRGYGNKAFVEIPPDYTPHPRTSQTSKTSLPPVVLRHFTLQPPKPNSLTTFINKVKLARLQWEVKEIKAKGVWIEKHGYFIGSLNNVYSKRYLLNLTEKLPLLLHEPPKPSREIPIVVSPETPIREVVLKVEKAIQKTSRKQPKVIIYRPEWATVLPPFNLSEMLRASLKIPGDMVVCDLVNLRPLHVQFKMMEEPVKVYVRAFTTETVPGCFGRYGRPIRFWQFGCSMCAWRKQCLQQTIEDMRKDWRKTVKVRRGTRYAYITVNLTFTPFKLNTKGQKKVQRLIMQYIMQHWNCKSIRKQWFAVNEKYISFKVFKKDDKEITNKTAEILSKYTEAQP